MINLSGIFQWGSLATLTLDERSLRSAASLPLPQAADPGMPETHGSSIPRPPTRSPHQVISNSVVDIPPHVHIDNG